MQPVLWSRNAAQCPIVSTATVLADPDTSADRAEASDAPAAVIMERDGPVPKKNRRSVGSFGQRWNDRASRSAVIEDMQMKCCSGRCIGKLTMDQVMAERTEQKKHGSEDRRTPFRTCLLAFVRVDGAERWPGRREHFSCLGRS